MSIFQYVIQPIKLKQISLIVVADLHYNMYGSTKKYRQSSVKQFENAFNIIKLIDCQQNILKIKRLEHPECKIAVF